MNDPQQETDIGAQGPPTPKGSTVTPAVGMAVEAWMRENQEHKTGIIDSITADSAVIHLDEGGMPTVKLNDCTPLWDENCYPPEPETSDDDDEQEELVSVAFELPKDTADKLDAITQEMDKPLEQDLWNTAIIHYCALPDDERKRLLDDYVTDRLKRLAGTTTVVGVGPRPDDPEEVAAQDEAIEHGGKEETEKSAYFPPEILDKLQPRHEVRLVPIVGMVVSVVDNEYTGAQAIIEELIEGTSLAVRFASGTPPTKIIAVDDCNPVWNLDPDPIESVSGKAAGPDTEGAPTKSASDGKELPADIYSARKKAALFGVAVRLDGCSPAFLENFASAMADIQRTEKSEYPYGVRPVPSPMTLSARLGHELCDVMDPEIEGLCAITGLCRVLTAVGHDTRRIQETVAAIVNMAENAERGFDRARTGIHHVFLSLIAGDEWPTWAPKESTDPKEQEKHELIQQIVRHLDASTFWYVNAALHELTNDVARHDALLDHIITTVTKFPHTVREIVGRTVDQFAQELALPEGTRRHPDDVVRAVVGRPTGSLIGRRVEFEPTEPKPPTTLPTPDGGIGTHAEVLRGLTWDVVLAGVQRGWSLSELQDWLQIWAAWCFEPEQDVQTAARTDKRRSAYKVVDLCTILDNYDLERQIAKVQSIRGVFDPIGEMPDDPNQLQHDIDAVTHLADSVILGLRKVANEMRAANDLCGDQKVAKS